MLDLPFCLAVRIIILGARECLDAYEAAQGKETEINTLDQALPIVSGEFEDMWQDCDSVACPPSRGFPRGNIGWEPDGTPIFCDKCHGTGKITKKPDLALLLKTLREHGWSYDIDRSGDISEACVYYDLRKGVYGDCLITDTCHETDAAYIATATALLGALRARKET